MQRLTHEMHPDQRITLAGLQPGDEVAITIRRSTKADGRSRGERVQVDVKAPLHVEVGIDTHGGYPP